MKLLRLVRWARAAVLLHAISLLIVPYRSVLAGLTALALFAILIMDLTGTEDE